MIWGNHENDLPHRHVMERVKDYNGVWINTNMQSYEAMPYQVDKAVGKSILNLILLFMFNYMSNNFK